MAMRDKAKVEGGVLIAQRWIEHVRDRLIASGRATADEIERHLAAVDAGALDVTLSPMISACGRRPDAG